MRLILFLLCVSGCHRWDEEFQDDLRVISKVKSSDSVGKISFTFELKEEETHFLATALPEVGFDAYVDTVYGPGGELLFFAPDYWESRRNRTNAIFASSAATLGMPILPSDPPLVPGEYEIVLGVVNADLDYTSGVECAMNVSMKSDSELTGGHLLVNMVYAGGVEDDDSLMGGMDTVFTKWQEMYDQTGITLEFVTTIWDGDVLEAPSIGSEEEYKEISGASDFRSVNVVVVPEIALWDDLFGIAGHIPGPLVAAPNGAVLVSASLALGPNGVFDSGEKRVFAETLAHETGHYLGLYHPVEIGWDMWDALDDTEECTSEATCIDGLVENLMFAFPYCSSNGCVPQNQLTNEQSDAMNLYVGVD